MPATPTAAAPAATSPQVATYLKDAITHLERAAAAAAPGDLVLHFTLGRLYLRTDQPQKAVDSLNRVVSLNPGSVQARLALAQAHASSDNLPRAIDTLAIIVDDEPRVAAALGQYQEQAGQFREAAASYTKALEAQPMSREIKARRIAALFGAGDLPGAAAAAADAQRQHPEDARFPRLRARALFDGGSRNDGLSVMEAAARSFPKDSNTLYQLADMYKDAGRNPDAEKALRQLLSVEPANANALNYLGYLLALRGDRLDEAIELVRKALVAEPDNGAFLDSLGWAYYRKGDLGEAERYLGQAATRLPRNSEVQDHLGDVLAKRGRLPDAVDGLDARARGRRHRHRSRRDTEEDRRRAHQAAAVGGARLRTFAIALPAQCSIARLRRPVVTLFGGLRALCLASSVAAAACAPARLTLPTDAGSPLPDLAGVHAQVSQACRGVRTFTADLGLSGHAGRTRLRGRVRGRLRASGVDAPRRRGAVRCAGVHPGRA